MAIEKVGPGGVTNSYGVRYTRQPASMNIPKPKDVYTAFNPEPVAGLAITISGNPVAGGTLTATLPWGLTATSGQWYRDVGAGPVPISGQTAATYLLDSDDITPSAADSPYKFSYIATGVSFNSTPMPIASGVAIGSIITPTLRQIATRSIFPSARAATGTQTFRFHSAHQVFGASGGNITVIRPIYANFFSQDETSSGGVLSMALAVEYPAGSGNQVQITLGGQDIMTAASGAFIVPDLIDVSSLNIPDGAWIRIKGAANCPQGVVFGRNGSSKKYGATYDLMASAGTTLAPLSSVRTDSAAVWNARPNDQANPWCIKPCAVLGMGTVPALFMPADSRSCESGDEPDDLTLLAGVAERFTGGVYPFINAGQAGDKAYQWVSGEHGTKRLTMKQYCQGALNAMGTNDVPQPASSYLGALTDLDASMKTLMGTTVTPYMGVTLPPNVALQNPSYYNTVAGQSPVSSSAMRLSFNAWRKSQEGVLYDKLFRQDEVSADATNPDRWAVGPLSRNVTGTVVAGSSALTSSTANFTEADNGTYCIIDGADTAGVPMPFIVEYVNATTVNMRTGAGVLKPAVISVTAGVLHCGCQYNTADGIHESAQGGKNIKVLGLTARL